jgi:hypothetical protein
MPVSLTARRWIDLEKLVFLIEVQPAALFDKNARAAPLPSGNIPKGNGHR